MPETGPPSASQPGDHVEQLLVDSSLTEAIEGPAQCKEASLDLVVEHWSDKTVSVDLSRESIKNAPTYDSTVGWSRDQELNLYRHYGRRGYWAGSPLLETEI